LYGKTEQQKKEFFESLIKFVENDPVFFEEQYFDLQPHEKDEFTDYVIKREQNLSTMKELLNIIEKLLQNISCT
ncbi:MAG: hypothetical protein ACE5ES_05610, partial [Candidatus Nanoarchaeia archaeon]